MFWTGERDQVQYQVPAKEGALHGRRHCKCRHDGGRNPHQHYVRHQLPGFASEEELAECSLSVHQVVHGEAGPYLLNAGTVVGNCGTFEYGYVCLTHAWFGCGPGLWLSSITLLMLLARTLPSAVVFTGGYIGSSYCFMHSLRASLRAECLCIAFARTFRLNV